MLLKGGYYYSHSIKANRDVPPKGHILFVLSSGHTQLFSKERLRTKHPLRKDFQLLYVNHGAIHYFDEDGTEHIAPENSFLLYKPLDFQQYEFYLCDGADIYWCHFAGPFAENLLKTYGIYEKRNILLPPDKKYRRLYTAMRVMLENKPDYYAELCSLYLQELIVTMGSELKGISYQKELPKSLKAALEYINEHYFENITVGKLGEIAMLSKIALTRQFEKYMNCSPKKYLNRFRIEKSKVLLAQTDHRISEIALAVGFGDPLYFSTAFRAETGVSPREYRNALRQNTE